MYIGQVGDHARYRDPGQVEPGGPQTTGEELVYMGGGDLVGEADPISTDDIGEELEQSRVPEITITVGSVEMMVSVTARFG